MTTATTARHDGRRDDSCVRGFNSVFGKVGRISSDEAVRQLVKYKMHAYSAVGLWFSGVESEQISVELPRFCGKPISRETFQH